MLPLLLVGLGATALDAQYPERSEFVLGRDGYTLRQWTVDNGLPSNRVMSLAQTPDGYVWIGTSNGLLRFDGYRFVDIDLTTDRDSSHLWAEELAVDTAGTLWAVLRGQGETGELARRMGDSWHSVRHYASIAAMPSKAVAAPDGAIWLAAGNSLEGGVERGWDGSFTRYDVPGVHFEALAVTRSGVSWAGTRSAEAVNIVGDRVTRLQLEEPARQVLSLAEGADGTMWFGTWTGLYDWNGEVFQRQPLPEGRVWHVLPTRGGHLWVNVERTLHRIATASDGRDGATVASTAALNDLGVVRASLEDAEGNMWFGTQGGGLVQLHRELLPAPVNDPDDPIDPLFVRDAVANTAQSMWLLEDCRARILQPDGTRRTLTEGFPAVELFPKAIGAGGITRLGGYHPDCVNGFAALEDGTLWYTHGQNLVTRVEDGVATDFAYPSASPTYVPGSGVFPQGRPGHLTVGSSGELWFVRQGEGIVRLSRAGEQRVYDFPGDSAFPDVTGLVPGRSNEVWYLTSTGFGNVSLNEGDRWFTEHWPSRSRATDAYPDPEGRIWISTLGNGLLMLHGDSLSRVSTDDGLHSNWIYQIVEADAENLWLTSPAGVMVVARGDLQEYVMRGRDQLDVGLISPRDGAPTFRTTQQVEKGPDGRIWLLGDGVAIADPETMPWNDAAPTVIIESVLADGERLPPYEPILVPPGTERLEFRYAAPTFVAPERVRFRYRLDAVSEPWVDGGGERVLAFSRPWPRRYALQLSARKNFGPWSDPVTVQFRVLPMWWQAQWFIFASVLLILGLGAGGQALRMRSVRARNIALEREIEAREVAEVELKALGQRMITAQEEDRARIGRDLHDDISQRLHAAAIGVAPVLGAVANDDAATAQLRELQAQLDGVAEDTRRISHELHPALLQMLGLVPAIEGLCEDFESATGIPVNATVPESIQRGATNEVALGIYRITQEALRNVEKHAKASAVDVELSESEGSIVLRIVDDGVGFDPRDGHGGLGLASVSERVRLLDGSASIESERGAGTTLTVKVPAAKPTAD